MFKVKRLTPTAKLPTRANLTDAGLDIYADEHMTLPSEIPTYAAIRTGIAISIPDGYVARIAPRSGLAINHGIDTLAGVVDSSYRGEIKVVLINHGGSYYTVQKGDKIAQLLIQPVELWTPVEALSLDETDRGANGFGSSGKQ